MCTTSGAERRKGGGGVEINSLHSEDRCDTPRKYSTALEIDTTVNLSASPAALWRIREATVAGSKFYTIVIPAKDDDTKLVTPNIAAAFEIFVLRLSIK